MAPIHKLDHFPDADATRPDVAPGGHRGVDDGVGEEDPAQSEQIQNTTEDTEEDFFTEVQGDTSGRLKPPVDLVPSVPAAD